MCDQCSNWADHPRHHGQSDIGRLRDGTPVDPAHYPAAPAYPQRGSTDE
jgi:hypothetical protein